MVERRDVEFIVDGGDRLRGWLFLPSKRTGQLPAISLAHGYAGIGIHIFFVNPPSVARGMKLAAAVSKNKHCSPVRSASHWLGPDP